jgi:hypothetical protein
MQIEDVKGILNDSVSRLDPKYHKPFSEMRDKDVEIIETFFQREIESSPLYWTNRDGMYWGKSAKELSNIRDTIKNMEQKIEFGNLLAKSTNEPGYIATTLKSLTESQPQLGPNFLELPKRESDMLEKYKAGLEATLAYSILLSDEMEESPISIVESERCRNDITGRIYSNKENYLAAKKAELECDAKISATKQWAASIKTLEAVEGGDVGNIRDMLVVLMHMPTPKNMVEIYTDHLDFIHRKADRLYGNGHLETIYLRRN